VQSTERVQGETGNLARAVERKWRGPGCALSPRRRPRTTGLLVLGGGRRYDWGAEMGKGPSVSHRASRALAVMAMRTGCIADPPRPCPESCGTAAGGCPARR
jgi:hypothetical protein